jgi:glycosidase
MPVTNVKEDVEWGYTPLGYFAPDDRYGGAAAFRGLVAAWHAAGVAVVLDAVYAHAHPEFAYNLVYRRAGLLNPVMGPFGSEFGGLPPGWDYHRPFTRDFFDAVNRYWLTEFQVDGFRYDYVPGFWDGVAGDGYSGLVYRTYRLSQDFGSFPRFFAGDGARSRIIQCAEFLDAPVLALTATYSNTAWQNQLLDAAITQARGASATDDYARRLDPELGPEQKYPSVFVNQADRFPVAPFQYIESHDHARFVTRLGVEQAVDQLEMPLGDRSLWARTQPYAIAQYNYKGVPMRWAR